MTETQAIQTNGEETVREAVDSPYTQDWHGCYNDGWKGHIVDDAFAHPAKMAYGLLERILRHMAERGWIGKADVIGDPFGGIGSTGILGSAQGYRVIMVELEGRFVELAERNFALTRRHRDAFGDIAPVIIHGDSREFARLVGECAAVVCSPPFVDSGPTGAPQRGYPALSKRTDCKHKTTERKSGDTVCVECGVNLTAKGMVDTYGSSPGQIGAMKAGKLDCVVTSPPFVDSMSDKPSSQVLAGSGGRMGVSCKGDGYGQSPGQIGALKAGKLDAVVKTGLTNTPASPTIGHHEQRTTAQAAGSQPGAVESGGDDVEFAAGTPSVALSRAGMVASESRGTLRSDTRGDAEGVSSPGHQAEEQGATGAGSLPLQGREVECPVSADDREGQVQPVRDNDGSGRAPQERGPLRQPARQPGGDVQPVPHESHQAVVVEGEESGQADAEGERACGMETLQAVITSPPWENQEPSHAQGSNFEDVHRKLHPGKLAKGRPGLFAHEYGATDGQIGNTTSDTYWEACARVYDQVMLALKPSGIFVLVLKDYIKAGKRVPLCDDTLTLLTSLGFEPVERIRAMLVKVTKTDGLFGEIVETTKKCSFFRRLYEAKYPHNAIDWEEVLIVRKANT